MDKLIALEGFRKKFMVEDNLILSTKSWSWSVRPMQPTLGTGIISLNRYAEKLSDITSAEMAEFAELVFVLEKTLKKTFDYDAINYLMLMMVDKHVHYHVIPRYKSKKIFADFEWIDEGWPSLPNIMHTQNSEKTELLLPMIKNEITKHL